MSREESEHLFLMIMPCLQSILADLFLMVQVRLLFHTTTYSDCAENFHVGHIYMVKNRSEDLGTRLEKTSLNSTLEFRTLHYIGL